MPRQIDRREFVSASLLSAGVLSYWPPAIFAQPAPGSAATTRPRAHPFALSQVRLRPGPALDAMNTNRR
ncbi:MAG: hypothetical protein ACREUC_05175, partial [Steroidobacteraceae bacterium]